MVSIGAQFSTGDQSASARVSFWRSGFSKCQNSSCPDRTSIEPKPKRADGRPIRTIKSVDHPAGCRMNGDAYGTTVFSCETCGWSTSFQYDDASEPYYYETRFYKEQDAPNPPPHPWAGIDVRSWLSFSKIDPRIATKLRAFGLDGPTMSEMGERQLRALGLTPPEAAELSKAIRAKDEELRRKCDNDAANWNEEGQDFDETTAANFVQVKNEEHTRRHSF